MGLTGLDNHIAHCNDRRMAQHLQDFNLSKSRNGYAFFLVVHQDTFERHDAFGDDVGRFVDLPITTDN